MGCGVNKESLVKHRISPRTHYHQPLKPIDRERLVTSAKKFLIEQHRKGNDCSEAIKQIFADAGLFIGSIAFKDDDNGVKTIYRYVKKYGKIIKNEPLPGDLVFFHNTYDRNRSGRMDDALTHMGIVESLENDTVFFIHKLGPVIIRSKMNLKLKNVGRDKKTGHRINDILRRAQAGYRAYNAAELFAGFGRL